MSDNLTLMIPLLPKSMQCELLCLKPPVEIST